MLLLYNVATVAGMPLATILFVLASAFSRCHARPRRAKAGRRIFGAVVIIRKEPADHG